MDKESVILKSIWFGGLNYDTHQPVIKYYWLIGSSIKANQGIYRRDYRVILGVF